MQKAAKTEMLTARNAGQREQRRGSAKKSDGIRLN